MGRRLFGAQTSLGTSFTASFFYDWRADVYDAADENTVFSFDGAQAPVRERLTLIRLFEELRALGLTTAQKPRSRPNSTEPCASGAPAGWKGDATRETQVLNALFPIMG